MFEKLILKDTEYFIDIGDDAAGKDDYYDLPPSLILHVEVKDERYDTQ